MKTIDIEKLKLPQNYTNMAGAEKVTTRIPGRKPRRQSLFGLILTKIIS
ncbi:hypothetical protein ACFLZ5_04565 [Thermodesulfobacteriota bacterium]